jgi:hypothetical protein
MFNPTEAYFPLVLANSLAGPGLIWSGRQGHSKPPQFQIRQMELASRSQPFLVRDEGA